MNPLDEDIITEWDVDPRDYSFESVIPVSASAQAQEDFAKLLAIGSVAQENSDELARAMTQLKVEDKTRQASAFKPFKPMIKILNQEKLDANIERKIRVTQVLGKFASTVALKPIAVEIDEQAPYNVPAYSDASTIYLSTKSVNNLDKPETVIAIKGLGLHETAHIVFTPRNSTKIIQWCNSNDLLRAMNALEDQRIETSMVAMFRSTSDWLVGAVAEHILDCNEEDVKYLFPIIHGRKYLDRNIRQHIREAYAEPENVQEIADLIDEYVALNLADAKNYARAQEIIQRYNELVNGVSKPNPQHPDYPTKGWQNVRDPNGHGHRPCEGYKVSGNKTMDKKQAETVAKKVADEVAKDKKEDEAQAAQAQGDKPSEVQDSGDAGKDGPLKDTDAGKITLSDTVGQGVSEVSKGLTTKEWANKTIEAIVDRNARSIELTIAQIGGHASLSGKEMKAPAHSNSVWYRKPSTPAIVSTRGFHKELEQLRAEFDPSWHRRVDSGRLNIQRLFTGGQFDEAFDLWDQGVTDAMDIECVIALDTSGSMGYQMSSAFEYMWVIKRALDKIGASTTVTTFSHKVELLYSADERASTHYRAIEMGDSTSPFKGIEYSRSILANSDRAIKLFIVITDGVWNEPKRCDDIIKQLRKGGVITSLALLSDEPTKSTLDSHGCELAVVIKEPKDLNLLARNIVRSSVRQHASRSMH